ncbi:MAG: hypothetical protein H6621_09180 [Halobacteriovoraceae bacterium]|nr:hypothetical protein [Halobacteriovoraceae bacterium]MCB9095227.1 hypothetical protein [Halobacteriovoraceae bacterium]
MSQTINVLTNRIDQFKESLFSEFDFCFNEDLDDYEFNIIDFQHCNEFDEDLIFTHCLYFSDNIVGLRENGFSDIKPDFFVCCEFSELPSKIHSFMKYTESARVLKDQLVCEHKLKKTSDINKIVDESLNILNISIEHLKSRYILVMQEVLTNALFDSPVDDSGNPIYRYTNRENEVSLEDGKEAEVKIYANDDEIVIYTKDFYGSLLAKTIKNYLFKEIIAPETKEGGAGIGLNVIFNNSNGMNFNIDLDNFTCLWVILKKTRQFKKFLNSSKEVFIKENRSF